MRTSRHPKGRTTGPYQPTVFYTHASAQAPNGHGKGESPIPSSTAKLAAELETKLTQEVGGPVGNVLPLPHKGSVTALQADIDKLAGRTVLVESTAAGYGDGEAAPKMDWLSRRIGAAPPESMIGLRKDVQASILAACGCPGSLLERADGTLAREEMRRFLHSTISPVARVVASELEVKLDTPGLSFDFSALFASDLSGAGQGFPVDGRRRNGRHKGGGAGGPHGD